MEMWFSSPIVIRWITVLFVFVCAKSIESPQYTVVHTESDFEIRLYRETAWMSAPVREISFEKATKEGFHRLYQYIRGGNANASRMMISAPVLTSVITQGQSSNYIVRLYLSKFQGLPPLPLPQLNLQLEKWGDHCVAIRKFSGFANDNNVGKEAEDLVADVGRSHLPSSNVSEDKLFQYIQGANLNFSRISMTAPVITSIVPEAGPLHSSAYFIRLYLPVKFQSNPPLPLPELHLQHDTWMSHCIAVRQFSGFAQDSNIVKEAEMLAVSLSRSPWANSTTSEGEYAYSIAQYNSPFRIFRRLNEVWVDIDGSGTEGCQSTSLAS